MRGMSSTPSTEHQNSQVKASSNAGSDISSLSPTEPLKLGTEAKSKARLSFWVQWTLPMANLSLLASNGKQKLTVSIEDYQSSFDWSVVYFQAKAKVLAAGIRHQVKRKMETWTEGPNQGLVVTFGDEITGELETVSKGNSSTELISEERLAAPLRKTCFSLVFTRAQCRNLHKKWQELMKNKLISSSGSMQLDQETSQRFISEVDMKLAPVDVIADAEALLPFIRMLSRPMHIKWLPQSVHPIHSTGGQDNLEPLGFQVNNGNLPLVYLKAKSIRFFCPTHTTMATAVSDEEDATAAADMIFANVDTLSISPQADNPISRILIKPDIYHLSQPVLDIPGAMVENRQYQIDVKGAGIFTGKWNSILKHSSKPERPAELQVRSENPALEWNIAASQQQPETANDSDPLSPGWHLVMMPVIRKFDLQVQRLFHQS